MGKSDCRDKGSSRVIERLRNLVCEWDDVEARSVRPGVVEFRVDRREIGHVHRNGVVDILFPVRIRRDLVASGRAEAHHTLRHTGWVSVRIRTEHDIPGAIALLRLNYERLRGVASWPSMPTLPVSSTARLLGDGDIGELQA